MLKDKKQPKAFTIGHLRKDVVKKLYENNFEGFKKWIKSYPQNKGVSNDVITEWFNIMTDTKLETKKDK